MRGQNLPIWVYFHVPVSSLKEKQTDVKHAFINFVDEVGELDRFHRLIERNKVQWLHWSGTKNYNNMEIEIFPQKNKPCSFGVKGDSFFPWQAEKVESLYEKKLFVL